MRKRILSLLLAGAMSVTMLAGCGGSGKASGKTEGNTAKEDPVQTLIKNTKDPVNLTLWCSETEAYQKVMKERVDAFEKQYPKVKFNITIGAESEANCKDDVLKDVEAAADVFVFPDD